MARQSGIIKLNGTLGDITFYKGKAREGRTDLARTKGGVDGDTIANSPNFARTRENNSEFGLAARFGKLIREAFSPQIASLSDSTLVYRLTQEMTRIKNLDTVNVRGQRTVLGANIPTFEGFLFNGQTKIDTVFTPEVVTAFATPNITFTVPAHIPVTSFRAPQGATHAKIKAAAAAIDVASESVVINSVDETAEIDIFSSVQFAQDVLSCSVLSDAGDIIIGVLSIEFYQKVNAVSYLLSNGSYTPMEATHAGIFAV